MLGNHFAGTLYRRAQSSETIEAITAAISTDQDVSFTDIIPVWLIILIAVNVVVSLPIHLFVSYYCPTLLTSTNSRPPAQPC